jgi:hypothetical protein
MIPKPYNLCSADLAWEPVPWMAWPAHKQNRNSEGQGPGLAHTITIITCRVDSKPGLVCLSAELVKSNRNWGSAVEWVGKAHNYGLLGCAHTRRCWYYVVPRMALLGFHFHLPQDGSCFRRVCPVLLIGLCFLFSSLLGRMYTDTFLRYRI